GIGEWCERVGVDAWYRAAPTLVVATSEAQLDASEHAIEACEALGAPEEIRRLKADELRARCDAGFLGGAILRTSATVQPARLAVGLRAKVVEAGVRLHERTPVRRLRADAVVVTPRGRVRAGHAVLAVNSATASFHGFRLAHAVASSHMVVTEPVPDVLEELGWTGGEAIADGRTLLHYLRTTRDGRIAFGWGGGRMGFGARHLSRLDVDPDAARRPVALLPATSQATDHERLGRADRRLPHPPPDLRQPRTRPPRLRLHRKRRRAVLPRRRDPRAARPRPPGRADPARDRRALAEADAARAVPLGGRVGHTRRPRPRGRRGGRWPAPRPGDPVRHGAPAPPR